MLDALLRCMGVALVTLLFSLPASGGLEPLKLDDFDGAALAAEIAEGRAIATNPLLLPGMRMEFDLSDSRTADLALFAPALSDEAAPAEILIPLPAPFVTGIAGLAGVGAALACRRFLRFR